GTAAGQDRTKPVLAHVLGGGAGDVALDDLADLLLDRHRGQQLVDLALELGVLRERPLGLRPVRRVDAAVGSGCGGGTGRVRGGGAVAAAGGQQHGGGQARGQARDGREGTGCTHGSVPYGRSASRHVAVQWRVAT